MVRTPVALLVAGPVVTVVVDGVLMVIVPSLTSDPTVRLPVALSVLPFELVTPPVTVPARFVVPSLATVPPIVPVLVRVPPALVVTSPVKAPVLTSLPSIAVVPDMVPVFLRVVFVPIPNWVTLVVVPEYVSNPPPDSENVPAKSVSIVVAMPVLTVIAVVPPAVPIVPAPVMT